jgi:hypothetical protein
VRDSSEAQARAIAATELNRLANGASITTMTIVSNATGSGYRKQWLVASGAEHPRHETYADLGGQTVPLHAYFEVKSGPLPGRP